MYHSPAWSFLFQREKPFIPLPDEQKDRSSDDSAERGAVIKGETEEKFYNIDILIKILNSHYLCSFMYFCFDGKESS